MTFRMKIVNAWEDSFHLRGKDTLVFAGLTLCYGLNIEDIVPATGSQPVKLDSVFLKEHAVIGDVEGSESDSTSLPHFMGHRTRGSLKWSVEELAEIERGRLGTFVSLKSPCWWASNIASSTSMSSSQAACEVSKVTEISEVKW